MTTDRRKAILFLSITLIIGILIGSMLPGIIFKFRRGNMGEERRMRGGHSEHRMSKRDWLGATIVKVAKPDSDQMKLIRPIISQTQEKLGALEGKSNQRMMEIMDSMKLQLKPILTEQQNKDLDEFSARARQRWRRTPQQP